MSEAFREIIRFLFEDVCLNRIEAYHDPRNPHSGDVMKKCGLLYEGTARQSGKKYAGHLRQCALRNIERRLFF